MSYVAKTLAPHETIYFRAKFHWLYTLQAFLWLIFLGIILVGIYQFFALMIRMWTTEIVVTTDRLVVKTGFISRKTQEVSLEKVEEIKLHQSIMGRILGYGDIDIHGTGVGNIQLPTIDDPVALRRAIQEARANYRGDVENSVGMLTATPARLRR